MEKVPNYKCIYCHNIIDNDPIMILCECNNLLHYECQLEYLIKHQIDVYNQCPQCQSAYYYRFKTFLNRVLYHYFNFYNTSFYYLIFNIVLLGIVLASIKLDYFVNLLLCWNISFWIITIFNSIYLYKFCNLDIIICSLLSCMIIILNITLSNIYSDIMYLVLLKSLILYHKKYLYIYSTKHLYLEIGKEYEYI
jgi:hypothetical protein